MFYTIGAIITVVGMTHINAEEAERRFSKCPNTGKIVKLEFFDEEQHHALYGVAFDCGPYDRRHIINFWEFQLQDKK